MIYFSLQANKQCGTGLRISVPVTYVLFVIKHVVIKSIQKRCKWVCCTMQHTLKMIKTPEECTSRTREVLNVKWVTLF